MRIQLPEDEAVPDEELARQWGVSRKTLRRYEIRPNGLPFLIIGGKKFRPLHACRTWLAAQVRLPNPSRNG